MKHMVEIRIPATKEKRVGHITCDLCAEPIVWHAGDPPDKVVIKKRVGSIWPEGGSGEDIEFDVCDHCFDSKLIPWFKSQGADPQITEWDF